MLEHLKALCALDGVSGNEREVRDYVAAAASRFADEIKTDPLGNVIAFRRGHDRSKRIMLAAHMDEVGLIIRSVTAEGFLKFATVGGIDRRVLLGRQVRIDAKSGKIPGVLGICPVHLASDKKKPPKEDELYIDIGAKDKEEAAALVSPGDFTAFATEPAKFGEGRFKAKAIDDRLGCAILLNMLESGNTPQTDTCFVFTVQEEVGGRGAAAAAYTVNPDAALVIEGTTAADLPGVLGDKRVCLLGGGAVINYMDKGTIYSPEMSESLRELANTLGIAWQVKTLVAGGTDAGKIHVSRAGIPCAGLAAPVRYIHAPVSLVDLKDAQAVLELATAFVF